MNEADIIRLIRMLKNPVEIELDEKAFWQAIDNIEKEYVDVDIYGRVGIIVRDVKLVQKVLTKLGFFPPHYDDEYDVIILKHKDVCM